MPAGTTPMGQGASATILVVRYEIGWRDMVLPISQPWGLRWVRQVRRKVEGWSMCSRTSKRVMKSYFGGGG